jgi:CubicO group peptidase (beta-lactamase class C family)
MAKLLFISLTIIFLLLLSFNYIFAQSKPKNAENLSQQLQKIIDKTIDQKRVFGAVVEVHAPNFEWRSAAGNLQPQTQYFIASTTKIYVTAIIMKLREQGKLSIDDKISKYLSTDITNQLHIYKNKDYSKDLTIKHLLAHTSGLPDYFQGKKADGKSLLEDLSQGNDKAWTFEEIIALSKTMKPDFEPDQKGKALYSDTNFQLLGKIIEVITGETIEKCMQKMLFEPLKLEKTYLYVDPTDKRPSSMYYKNKPLPIPLAMTSFKADGGIVSTAAESMIFLKAFFGGQLFPKTYLDEMYIWNDVMFPLEYGIGVMRFKLPRIFSPFKAIPEGRGHSGLSGAFSFYYPEKELFIVGTINQIDSPSLSYKLMAKLLSQF